MLADVPTGVHDKFEVGDVFVAVSGGKVQWRLPDGTLNKILDTGAGGFTTGMALRPVASSPEMPRSGARRLLPA